MRGRGPGQKGSYGDARLPVSDSYLRPGGRRRSWLLGLAFSGAIAALLLADQVGRGGGMLSNGPLSSAHALFGDQCQVCHDRFDEASDERCSACHEQFGSRLGVYSVAAHVLYRSGDLARMQESRSTQGAIACRTCHLEHAGRDAEPTRVGDAQCKSCHGFGSFERGHPEFDFAAEEIPDPAGLRFPHIRHVREVMRTGGVEAVERACLHCHNPRADGRGFEPLDFDRHCAPCHLPPSTGPPRLPVRQGAASGVETLETLRAAGGPESAWTEEVNPAAFRLMGGGRIMKLPVNHRDPWILANLRSLRQRLFPSRPLADLLPVSPDLPAGRPAALHQEAVATLMTRADAVSRRTEPEIQDDLGKVRRELNRLARRLRDPLTPLDAERFRLSEEEASGPAKPGAGPEVEQLVLDLTEPCRRCHEVRQATIRRVQSDQRTLVRAEFDHRAHLLQAGCLDCHARIPVLELLEGRDVPAETVDRAEIQNLPSIETCRSCHRAGGASARCATCHLFHADTELRGELVPDLG